VTAIEIEETEARVIETEAKAVIEERKEVTDGTRDIEKGEVTIGEEETTEEVMREKTEGREGSIEITESIGRLGSSERIVQQKRR
jgi:hypothetical protein